VVPFRGNDREEAQPKGAGDPREARQDGPGTLREVVRRQSHPKGETPRARLARFYTAMNAVGGVFPAGWKAAGMTAAKAHARIEKVGITKLAKEVRAKGRGK
jgi:hypothetical protein